MNGLLRDRPKRLPAARAWSRRHCRRLAAMAVAAGWIVALTAIAAPSAADAATAAPASALAPAAARAIAAPAAVPGPPSGWLRCSAMTSTARRAVLRGKLAVRHGTGLQLWHRRDRDHDELAEQRASRRQRQP